MENKVYTAMGLMSGTSLDGIDVALVRTDGMDYTELLDFQLFPYNPAVCQTIQKAFGKRHADDVTKAAEAALTSAHLRAIQDFMSKTDVKPDLIGFHGQTILHDPSQRFTWQIGDAQALADNTSINVVADMRMADVKAGGQGAPLLPLCHRAFASEVEKPIAILNMGGVGNVTWLGEERHDILAFDTGPASALIDDLVKSRTDHMFDKDGNLAKVGQADQGLIKKWLAHEYFKKPAPKSLDRNEWDVAEVEKLSLEDAAATLSEFTIQSIVQSMAILPNQPRGLFVTGGGRKNKYIMARLAENLPYPVEPVEALGWNGDALEAQGFAYLAVRSVLGLSLTLPTTTGIDTPMTGGALYKSKACKASRPA